MAVLKESALGCLPWTVGGVLPGEVGEVADFAQEGELVQIQGLEVVGG